MYYFLTFVVGVIAGTVGSVIYYRRNIAKVEAALAEATAIRDKFRAELEALKKKVGG